MDKADRARHCWRFVTADLASMVERVLAENRHTRRARPLIHGPRFPRRAGPMMPPTFGTPRRHCRLSPRPSTPSLPRPRPRRLSARRLRDARNAERGDSGGSATARGGGAPAGARGPKADAREMASLVGQLAVRRGEDGAHTGTTERRNVTRWAGRTSEPGRGALRSARLFFSGAALGEPRDDERRGPAKSEHERHEQMGREERHERRGREPRNIVRAGDRRRREQNASASGTDPTYKRGPDVPKLAVEQWTPVAARIPLRSRPDVRSVYSAALEDSFGVYALLTRPRTGWRVWTSAPGGGEPREAPRGAGARKGRSPLTRRRSAPLETDGMFTAGFTKTGVGVIDFFARDPVGMKGRRRDP